jgi:uridine kinase
MNDCERTVVVGIAGPTCSGKSTLADALARHAPDEVLVLRQDDYYRDLSGVSAAEIARINFDRPDAIDMPLLARHVRGLRMGFPARKPEYCRQNHRRAGVRTIAPRQIVVVEGLFVLGWPDIALELDLKVYLEADRDTIWKRRLRRDAAYGRTCNEVTLRFDDMTWPGHLKHVEPTRELADVVVQHPFDSDEIAVGLYARAWRLLEQLVPYSVLAAGDEE